MANKKNDQAAVGAADEALAPAVEQKPPKTVEGSAGEVPAPKAEQKPAKTAESPSGVWLYIGPNIKGVIHTGKLFRGSRAQVLKKAETALEKVPEIQRLIVAGETLTQDRARVKTPGNALYETYQVLAKKEKEGHGHE